MTSIRSTQLVVSPPVAAHEPSLSDSSPIFGLLCVTLPWAPELGRRLLVVRRHHRDTCLVSGVHDDDESHPEGPLSAVVGSADTDTGAG
jgi:hypothetical protein